MIKSLIKDMAKYLPVQIVPGIVGFISIPIITRLFTPEEYGNYILVIATVSVLSTIIGWLPMSIIRFYPVHEREGKLDEFCGNILKLTIISVLAVSLTTSGILVVLKPHISMKLYSLMWIGVVVFIVSSGVVVPLYFLRARRQVSWYSSFRIWNRLAAITFGILLVMAFRFDVSGLLWGSVLSLATVLPFLWKKAMKRVSLRPKGISLPLTSEMAKYGFPLVIGNLAAWILSLSDRYILEFFRGSKEVGIYSASYGISENSIMLLGTLFMLASGPIEMNVWEKEGAKKSQEFVSKLTRYYLIVCLPAMVGLSVLAKPLIGILTVQEYYEGYRIVPLVTLGAFFLGLQQRFLAGPLFYKRTHFVMFSIISSGFLNLGLNWLFIPRYGYVAAAFTTLISYAFLLFLMITVSRRYFVWEFPFKSLAKATCASSAMGIIVYYVGSNLTPSTLLNLILGTVVGVAVYFAMLFLLREPQKEEIQELRILKARILARLMR